MTLVASAVVRNEQGRYLAAWLDHLHGFCDAVVLLDDRSTDGTREQAEASGALVVANTGPGFYDDESACRNRLLAETYDLGPDHVLQVDADEFIGDPARLLEALKTGAPVYRVTMREVWVVDKTSLALRNDGMWRDRRTHLLWRCPPDASVDRPEWRVPAKKLACGREPKRVRHVHAADVGLAVYHFGWARRAERQARAQRYFDHDRGRFHADRHLQSILWDDGRVRLNWIPWPAGVPAAAADVAGRP